MFLFFIFEIFTKSSSETSMETRSAAILLQNKRQETDGKFFKDVRVHSEIHYTAFHIYTSEKMENTSVSVLGKQYP